MQRFEEHITRMWEAGRLHRRIRWPIARAQPDEAADVSFFGSDNTLALNHGLADDLGTFLLSLTPCT